MPGFSVWMADRAPGKKKRNAHANYLPRPAGGERAGVMYEPGRVVTELTG